MAVQTVSDNITKAIEHDLKVGVYFYSYANSIEEAKKQAKWIISKIKDYNIELPIVNAVYDILYNGLNPKDAVTMPMTRTKKAE